MDRISYLAYKAKFPKPKPTAWMVKVGGVIHLGPVDIRLAQHYIRTHNLTVSPTPIYS